MQLPKIQDAHVIGKKVLVRLDTDVDLNGEKIIDDTRLQAGWETVAYLLNHRANVIILGHLGRPEGVDPKLSLLPVAKWFNGRIKNHESRITETVIDGFNGWEIAGNLQVLENLRFFAQEEHPNTEFTQKLAALGNMYVNDAFAVSHRDHTSITGLPKLLPHFAGFHLQEEVRVLTEVLEHPKRPLTVIIGGAKLETKLPLVEKMHSVADYVLVGGKIAEETKTLIKVQHEKVPGHKSVLLVADLTLDKTDITENSVQNFLQIVQNSQTVVWNGPVGLIQDARDKNQEDTEKGTRELAKGIIASRVHSIIGGGDTLAYLKEIHLLDKFSFVSTGGGAMLSFLSGEKLPGIEALRNKKIIS